MINQFVTARLSEAIWRPWAPAIGGLVAAAALTAVILAPPARAAGNQRPPERSRDDTTARREAGDPIMAIVSIKSQRVTIYDADGWVMRAPVSSGTTGRETPAGVFAIVEKDKDHHSSLYDDAWMPNMERITWSGIALHGGPLPGYAASHGCVRMPYDFAEKLFDKTRIGMRVIISPVDAEPVDFSDPKLFVPSPDAVGAAPAKAEALASEATEAEKTAKDAKAAAAAAPRAAMTAAFIQRQLQGQKNAADAKLALADKAVAAAKTDEAKAEADDARQKAAAKVEELATKFDDAKADAKAKQDAIKALQDASKAADARKTATVKAAREAKLALEPVSVFISRATQKLYVRRDTHGRLPDGGETFDTFEVPITIRDPNRPLGTHVFTAVAQTDGGGLRWTAVTIDNGDDARDALRRVTIPQDVLDRIAPTAIPRSSIVISDEPLNRETNYRTEFVVVLNNQPQGGLAMRDRPEDENVAGHNGWGGGFFFFGRQGSSDPSPHYFGGQNFYERQW